jgi:hypothetical protein
MNIGFDKPLYIQPFDHRGSCQTEMFGCRYQALVDTFEKTRA